MERIGHYKIVSELGRGGMGVVYKAHEESLNRFVAIKVLGEHLQEDTEYVERFVREAKSAAALSHPNIVQIYAIAEEAGQHYFVMEFVRGTSVQRMIQTEGKLAPADAVRITLQAAAGLEEAHSDGVIHRDIKPANLMVTDKGLVKIADFGLALMGGATTRLTATGMLMGTPGYLSPEQCLDQSPDQRTDIYSLGVTLFEMVTGTMPFRADSPLALLKLIVEVDPPDVGELNPEVDDEIRAIIAKMLAKDRDARYGDCGALAADLRDWLESRGEPLQPAVVASTKPAVVPPPPPSLDLEDDINTQPTVEVPSGAAGPPQAPPPPPHSPGSAGTEPAPQSTEPAPLATAPATQPPGPAPRRRTGLVLAAVFVLVLLGAAAAAVLTVTSGVLDPIFGGEESTVAEPADGAAQASDPAGSDEAPVEMDPVASDAPAADDNVRPPAGREADGSIAPSGSSDDTQRAPPSGASAVQPGPPPAADTRGRSAADAETAPERPKRAAPAPTGTVVLAVGDQLFAVEAEDYVKGRLEQAGVEIIEVTAVPGLAGFVNTEARPDPEQVRAALRPFARFMVGVRVEYLGNRAIYYMGQRDTAHQARVHLTLVDLATGRPVGRPTNLKVEYTQLNAGEVASKELRRPTTRLVQTLPRE